MINLQKKLQQKRAGCPEARTPDNRSSIRDKLLVREVQEMESTLPRTCRVHFDDPNKLHSFVLFVSPDEGYWAGGRFRFSVDVPDDYNIVPPRVSCDTKIWHPNITEDGEVCLSLLRQNSLDSMGWAPTRKLKDVVWGLSSLFGDLLNFEDPLNVEAAEHYERDKDAFVIKVREYVLKHAKR